MDSWVTNTKTAKLVIHHVEYHLTKNCSGVLKLVDSDHDSDHFICPWLPSKSKLGVGEGVGIGIGTIVGIIIIVLVVTRCIWIIKRYSNNNHLKLQ